MQKLFRSLFAIGVVAGLAACGDDVTVTPPPEPVPPTVTAVSVSGPASIVVGETAVFSANVTTNGSGVNTDVTWTSGNASIASVSGSGSVTGVAAGQTTITATSVDNPGVHGSASVAVTVPSLGVQAIAVTPSAVTVAPGANNATAVAVNVTADPGVARDFSVSGGDPTIATATKSGSGILVTGVAAGGGTTNFSVASTVDPSITAALAVTVRPPVPATVSIQSITFGTLNTPVNVANVFGQLDVSVNLTSNDERVGSIDVLVDNRVVASQVFSASVQSALMERSAYAAAGITPPQGSAAVSAADVIVLSFRSDSFNTTTGAANFLNGNHVVKAVANVTSVTPTQRASNSYALVFNNSDGFYVTMDNTPKNGGIKSIVSAANGQEWRQGDVTVTSVPVVYTPTTPNGSTAETVCTRVIAWTPGPASVGAAAPPVAVGAPGACVSGSQNTTLIFPQGTSGYQSDPAQLSNGVLLRELPNITGVTFIGRLEHAVQLERGVRQHGGWRHERACQCVRAGPGPTTACDRRGLGESGLPDG